MPDGVCDEDVKDFGVTTINNSWDTTEVATILRANPNASYYLGFPF